MDEFDVSESGTHVALVVYSTTASVQLRFNEFTGAQLNAVNVKRKIQKLPHERGYTYIDKALELADTEIFSEKGGMRANVTKVNLSQKNEVKRSSILIHDISSYSVLRCMLSPVVIKLTILACFMLVLCPVRTNYTGSTESR